MTTFNPGDRVRVAEFAYKEYTALILFGPYRPYFGQDGEMYLVACERYGSTEQIRAECIQGIE